MFLFKINDYLPNRVMSNQKDFNSKMNDLYLNDLLVPMDLNLENLESEYEAQHQTTTAFLNQFKESVNKYVSRTANELACGSQDQLLSLEKNSVPEERTLENVMNRKAKVLNNLRHLEEKLECNQVNRSKGKSCNEELVELQKQYKRNRSILPKIHKYYENMFGYTVVSYETISEQLSQIGIQFAKAGGVINITINNSEWKIIDFDASAICSTEKEAQLKDQLKDFFSNPPLLMVHLRNTALELNKT